MARTRPVGAGDVDGAGGGAGSDRGGKRASESAVAATPDRPDANVDGRSRRNSHRIRGMVFAGCDGPRIGSPWHRAVPTPRHC
jgi:hypothetical protein